VSAEHETHDALPHPATWPSVPDTPRWTTSPAQPGKDGNRYKGTVTGETAVAARRTPAKASPLAAGRKRQD